MLLAAKLTTRFELLPINLYRWVMHCISLNEANIATVFASVSFAYFGKENIDKSYALVLLNVFRTLQGWGYFDWLANTLLGTTIYYKHMIWLSLGFDVTWPWCSHSTYQILQKTRVCESRPEALVLTDGTTNIELNGVRLVTINNSHVDLTKYSQFHR